MEPLPLDAVHPLIRVAWRAWLEANHADARGVWFVRYTKAAGIPDLTYAEAVEEALCFGWIDSRPGTLEGHRTKLWFSPRKRGSGWSAVNKERIERLTAAGLMAPASQAKIDAARADGSWTTLDSVGALEVPPDLTAAFDHYPGSTEHFDAFPRSARRAILDWINQAKRPETRTKRVEESARLASENVRANQWKPS